MKSQDKKAKRPGMRLEMRVSQRMALRQRVIIRTSIIMFLAALPFSIGSLFKSENAIANLSGNHNSNANTTEVTKNSSTTIGSSATQMPSANKNEGITAIANDVVNTGIFYVSNGTIISSEGNFTTTVAGNTDNRGDLYLGGDWNNDGTSTASAGKIYFRGTGNQMISGSAVTGFYNMEINKSSGSISLGNNATVSNVLTLTQGAFDLNSKKLIISNSATSAIATTSGYILSEKTDNASKVQWNIGITTGAHVIPFATSTGTAIPLSINLTSGNIGNVTASTYPSGSDNKPYPTTPVAVTDMKSPDGNDNSANVIDRFWQIDKSGVSGTANIIFTYATAEEPSSGEATMVAQRYNSGSGWETPVSGQTSNSAQNTVTAINISNYGVFAISKANNPLPIKLTYFKAKLNEKGITEINWVTAAEKDNDFFTIERSSDLKNIEDIGRVKGKGTCVVSSSYASADENPLQGTSYYRLRQTDYDGKTEVFNWVAINNSKIKTEELFHIEKVYPNPFAEEFTVSFYNPVFSTVELNLIDQNGRKVFSNKIEAEKGSNEYVFDNSVNIAPGNYFLLIISGDKKETVKLIKNK